MNGRFQMQGVKTGLQTGSSETLIGWKSGQTTYVPLWDRMEGAWLWTLENGRPGCPHAVYVTCTSCTQRVLNDL